MTESSCVDSSDETYAQKRQRILVAAVHDSTISYTRARGALLSLRNELPQTPESTDYILHAEAELSEAMRHLDGARFAVEALLAKEQA